MRALLLLVLGGGLIWAVLNFFPRSEEPTGPEGPDGPGGIEAPEQPADGTTGGAVDPDMASAGDASAPEQPAPVVVPPGGATGFEQDPKEEPSTAFQVPVGQADLIELGALMAHRGAVQDWLVVSDGLLGDDLEQAVAAFDLALGGARADARERAKRIGDPDALGGRVRWLLQRALVGDVQGAWPANVGGGSPLEHGMAMALRAHEAAALIPRNAHAQAAAMISSVLVDELNAPWQASTAALTAWTETMRKAQARHLWHPKGAWDHVPVEVQPGDSLTAIRKRYLADHPERVICTGLIQRANGMSSDMIHPGDSLRIPTGEVTLLADLDAHWLLYMIDGQVCESWPVGVGAPGEETITGVFTIGEKEFEPTWWRKGQDPVFYGEEENPLGTHYLTWFLDGQKTSYGFHGTWEPESIGKNESEGCIRMHNSDVEVLFSIAPVGARFLVQD